MAALGAFVWVKAGWLKENVWVFEMETVTWVLRYMIKVEMVLLAPFYGLQFSRLKDDKTRLVCKFSKCTYKCLVNDWL